MRARRAAAALLLAASLAAGGGCSPSSLTPFSSYRGPGDYETGKIDGVYAGPVSTGGGINFQVATGTVTNINLAPVVGGCSFVFQSANAYAIVDNTFSIDALTLNDDHVLLNGTLQSDGVFSGTYSAVISPRVGGTCPSSISGTYTATRP
jgi:hypothetical protein